MPRTSKLRPHRFPVDPQDVWTYGDVAQMDAVVAACALVAQADGWVTPQERKRMLDKMSQSPSIRFFGLHEVTVGFEALNIRFDRDIEDAEAVAEAAMRATAWTCSRTTATAAHAAMRAARGSSVATGRAY